MFGFLRRHRSAGGVPVTYDYRFTARFACVHEKDRKAIRESFELALVQHKALTMARIISWDGHAVTASFILSLPWAGGSGEEGTMDAAETMTGLITSMAVGQRLLWFARRGEGKLGWTNWCAMQGHPDLAELDDLAAVFYEDCEEPRG